MQVVKLNLVNQNVVRFSIMTENLRLGKGEKKSRSKHIMQV